MFPWFSLRVECTKAIIQSGITELVAYRPDMSEKKWGPNSKSDCRC